MQAGVRAGQARLGAAAQFHVTSVRQDGLDSCQRGSCRRGRLRCPHSRVHNISICIFKTQTFGDFELISMELPAGKSS